MNNQVNILFSFLDWEKSAKPWAMQLIKPNNLTRSELESMRCLLQEEIAGLQTQLDWVEDAIAKLDQGKSS